MFCYSTVGSELQEYGRSLFRFSNIRVEIEQQAYVANPYPKLSSFTHIFLAWDLTSIVEDFSQAGSVHRFQLGHTHPARQNIRRLLMWTHQLRADFGTVAGPALYDGTNTTDITKSFGVTNVNWLTGTGPGLGRRGNWKETV